MRRLRPWMRRREHMQYSRPWDEPSVKIVKVWCCVKSPRELISASMLIRNCEETCIRWHCAATSHLCIPPFARNAVLRFTFAGDIPLLHWHRLLFGPLRDVWRASQKKTLIDFELKGSRNSLIEGRAAQLLITLDLMLKLYVSQSLQAPQWIDGITLLRSQIMRYDRYYRWTSLRTRKQREKQETKRIQEAITIMR